MFDDPKHASALYSPITTIHPLCTSDPFAYHDKITPQLFSQRSRETETMIRLQLLFTFPYSLVIPPMQVDGYLLGVRSGARTISSWLFLGRTQSVMLQMRSGSACGPSEVRLTWDLPKRS